MKQAVRSAKFHSYSAFLNVFHHIDLDSLASALGYAWLISQMGGKAIAYITTPIKDFYLRDENLYALRSAGIKEPFDALYCSGEAMPLQASRFALVDHNVLEPKYASPGATVVAIIDHHADEGKHLTAEPRIIELVGSCASLVARTFASFNLGMPGGLATLLLSAILIDTKGLKTGGKAVDVDRESAAFLLPFSPFTEGEGITPPSDIEKLASVQFLTATLSKKKSDVADLSTKDLLRRDYKEYALNVQPSQAITSGLGTIPVSLSDFFAASKSPVKEIQDWFDERDVSVLGVLASYRDKDDKKRRKQLWVVKAADKSLAKKLWRGLESNKELDLERLDLEDVASDEPEFGKKYIVRAYKQGNTDASRKRTAPILQEILEGTD
jgi:exopolyphosphatase